MSKVITKSKLIELISQETDMPLKNVKKIFNSLLDNIQLTLALNGGVRFKGFGKFDSMKQKGRKYWSFKDNKTVKSEAQFIPVFRASATLKKKCEEVKSIDFRKEWRREFIFDLEIFDWKDKKLGELGDITRDGIMVVCPEPLQKKETYKIKIKFPKDIIEHTDWTFKARCIWNRESKIDEGYHNGLKIKNISKADKEIIEEILSEYAV